MALLQAADVATTFLGLSLGLREGDPLSASVLLSSPMLWVLLKGAFAASFAGSALLLLRVRCRRPLVWGAAAAALLPALLYSAWVLASNLILL